MASIEYILLAINSLGWMDLALWNFLHSLSKMYHPSRPSIWRVWLSNGIILWMTQFEIWSLAVWEFGMAYLNMSVWVKIENAKCIVNGTVAGMKCILDLVSMRDHGSVLSQCDNDWYEVVYLRSGPISMCERSWKCR